MPEQRSHGVHLSVTSAGVAAAMVDFLEDNGGFGDAEARSAIFFRNESGQIAARGKCIDEFLGVLFVLIYVLPIRVGKVAAKFPNFLANRLSGFLYG